MWPGNRDAGRRRATTSTEENIRRRIRRRRRGELIGRVHFNCLPAEVGRSSVASAAAAVVVVVAVIIIIIITIIIIIHPSIISALPLGGAALVAKLRLGADYQPAAPSARPKSLGGRIEGSSPRFVRPRVAPPTPPTLVSRGRPKGRQFVQLVAAGHPTRGPRSHGSRSPLCARARKVEPAD